MNSKKAKALRGIIAAAVNLGNGRISTGALLRIPSEMIQERKNELVWVVNPNLPKDLQVPYRTVSKGTPARHKSTSLRGAYLIMKKAERENRHAR